MRTIMVIITCCIMISNARLIERNTGKDEETQSTDSAPVRVSRQVFYDDMGLSTEDIVQTEEDVSPNIRKERYTNPRKNIGNSHIRTLRDSSKNTAHRQSDPANTDDEKAPKVLIKKPIPKFNEVDYEDFQGKVNKLPQKDLDSGEHEDEDFNLDDYDFDVNHDEFVGRGKPLEPRIKTKNNKNATKTNKPKVVPATKLPLEIKMKSKVVIPVSPVDDKKKKVVKKAVNKMKEDYYDDVLTTTKLPDLMVKPTVDDDSEESDESIDSVPLGRRLRKELI